MPLVTRTAVAIVVMTAAAVAFGITVASLIRIGPFHGPDVVATLLAVATVAPLWVGAVRTVVLAAIREHAGAH